MTQLLLIWKKRGLELIKFGEALFIMQSIHYVILQRKEVLKVFKSFNHVMCCSISLVKSVHMCIEPEEK
jgi:hypothetical protein